MSTALPPTARNRKRHLAILGVALLILGSCGFGVMYAVDWLEEAMWPR
jgi:hypothetical protein